MLAKILESIAYGVTRGIMKAIFDERRRQRKVSDEEITDDDVDRAGRFRDAVNRVREAGPDGSGSQDSP